MKNKFLALITIILILLGFFGLHYRVKKQPQMVSRTKLLMDTIVNIKVFSNDEDTANHAIDLAFERGKFLIENIFDYHIETSELAQLNKYAGVKGSAISSELSKNLKLAMDISQKTNGAFDVTSGSLKNIWDFEKEPFSVPSKDSINNALKFVDYSNIVVQGDSAYIKTQGTIIDLGAIAKGYIAQEMMTILQKNGIQKALINAGGEVALHNKTEMRDWVIAIQHPRKPDEYLGLLTVKNGAVATSGDYERFFFDDGKRYHHILNAKTGYPANELISVSILTDNIALADILATAVFVIGKDNGLQLVQEWKNVEALLVTNEGQIIITNGFKKHLNEIPDSIKIGN